jgi:hypothetical protein
MQRLMNIADEVNDYPTAWTFVNCEDLPSSTSIALRNAWTMSFGDENGPSKE